MNIAKASVIIPYYKKKKNIKQTIKSAISQTYSNLEIILIYDDEDHSGNVQNKVWGIATGVRSPKKIREISSLGNRVCFF